MSLKRTIVFLIRIILRGNYLFFFSDMSSSSLSLSTVRSDIGSKGFPLKIWVKSKLVDFYNYSIFILCLELKC